MSQDAKEPNKEVEASAQAADKQPAPTGSAKTEKAKTSAAPTNKDHASKSDSSTPSTGSKLTSIALILALVGIGIGAYSSFSLYQLQKQLKTSAISAQEPVAQIDSAALAAEIEQKLNSKLAAAASSQQQVEEMDQRLARLTAEQQQFAARFDNSLSNSQKNWGLAEAEHMVNMANLRLVTMQDIGSAQQLLNAADQILLNQNDNQTIGARQIIHDALAELHAIGVLDRTGIYVRLNALRTQANNLQTLVPNFKGDENIDPEAEGWDSWKQEIGKYVRIQVDSTEKIKPILAGRDLLEVRMAINLSLEQAQWAALNGQEQVYQAALEQAADTIQSFFNKDHKQANSLLQLIEELKTQHVNQEMPDLSKAAKAINAYITVRINSVTPVKEEH